MEDWDRFNSAAAKTKTRHTAGWTDLKGPCFLQCPQHCVFNWTCKKENRKPNLLLFWKNNGWQSFPILPSSPLYPTCVGTFVNVCTCQFLFSRVIWYRYWFFFVKLLNKHYKKEQKAQHIIHLCSREDWLSVLMHGVKIKLMEEGLKPCVGCGINLGSSHFQYKYSNWVTHPFSIYELVA